MQLNENNENLNIIMREILNNIPEKWFHLNQNFRWKRINKK